MKRTHLILISLLTIALLVGGVQAVTWTSANGCWTATDGAYTIVMWNATGTSSYTPPTGVTVVEYLIVAGGGGGGSDATYGSGGGGAGGFRNDSAYSISGLSGSISIIVGAGGASNTAGNPSQISGTGITTITAAGGGEGGEGKSGGENGGNGGSGGGGSGYYATSGGTATPSGQGYNGGGGKNAASIGGSGGGAGAVGSTGTDATVSNGGGVGKASSITGTPVTYAAGGGASTASGGAGDFVIPGGSGIGGNGGDRYHSIAATVGAAGTGSGGGGGANTAGAAGGSGIVIIKYANPVLAPVASFSSANISVATNSTASGWGGYSPFTMQFTNTSSAPINQTWVWNYTALGSSTPVTFNTTSAFPIYTFGSAGNYSIKLNVTNSVGTNISTQVTWVNVTSGTTIPIVQFNVDKTVVLFPGRIYFNDTSLNAPTQWNWSFGDGTWFNSTDANTGLNKSYQYLKRGRWIANLTVSNAAGTNTSASHSKSITVIGYQGFEIPPVNGVCEYSTSRPISALERLMTDCKICGICS